MAYPVYETDPLDTIKTFETGAQFSKESDLCDFIELNLQKICKSVFDKSYSMHKREFCFEQQLYFGQGRTKRVDFLVELEDNITVAIECKCTNKRTLIDSIGQILGYGSFNVADRLMIISAIFDAHLVDTIDKYKLPIDVLFLNKGFSLLYKYDR